MPHHRKIESSSLNNRSWIREEYELYQEERRRRNKEEGAGPYEQLQLTEKSRGRMEQDGGFRAAAADREEQGKDGTGWRIPSSCS
jgi:hypothetical protein